VVITALTAILGMVALSASLIGYLRTDCRLWERAVLAGGGLLLIAPGLLTDGVGILLFLLVFTLQAKRKQQNSAFA
jgi:TRAP-type uncharacterized transport system fused permease subunit